MSKEKIDYEKIYYISRWKENVPYKSHSWKLIWFSLRSTDNNLSKIENFNSNWLINSWAVSNSWCVLGFNKCRTFRFLYDTFLCWYLRIYQISKSWTFSIQSFKVRVIRADFLNDVNKFLFRKTENRRYKRHKMINFLKCHPQWKWFLYRFWKFATSVLEAKSDDIFKKYHLHIFK